MPLWIKEAAGKPYMPSNGSEGEAFHGMWCEKCERDKVMNGSASMDDAWHNPDLYCSILSQSFAVDELPEWKFNAEGWPTCTAFVPKGEKLPTPRCRETPDMFEALKEQQ